VKGCCGVNERSSVPSSGTLSSRPGSATGIGKCTGVVVKGDEEAELGMTGDEFGVKESLRVGHTKG
jgi:hypothetical protein